MDPGNDWDVGFSEREKAFARWWVRWLWVVVWTCFALFAFVVMATTLGFGK